MEPNRRALIVLHGDRSPLQELPLWAEGANAVIAADGGADFCLAAGLTPDLVVGDMDGVSREALGQIGEDRLLANDDQQSTDFQKSLAQAQRMGAMDLVVFGAEGTRLDHTLSALGAATVFDGRVRFVFCSAVVTLLKPPGGSLRAVLGSLVSLIPITESNVTAGSGLKWPVGGLVLSPGGKDGVSNVATKEQVRIELDSGCLLAFVGRHEGDIAW